MILVGKDHGCLVQLWGGCNNYRYQYKEQGTGLLPLGGFHHLHNYQTSLLLQANKMVVAKAVNRAHSPLDSSLSLPLHIQPLPHLVLSPPMCSGWNNANGIGGGKNLLQSQFQVLQRCFALRDKKPLYANTARVEESSIAFEEPNSKIRGLARKKASETEEEFNTSIRSIDMHEEGFDIQIFRGMRLSFKSYRKCLTYASKTNIANIKGVINTLSNIGLSKPEIGMVLRKIPSLLIIQPVQLSKVFHVITQLGYPEKSLAIICLHSPELLGSYPDDLTEMFEFFQSVGLTKEELVLLLHKRPRVFTHPLEKVKFCVNCLLQAGISKEFLCKIISAVSKLFTPVILDNLKARLEFLFKVGLTPEGIGRAITRRPNILSTNLKDSGGSYACLTQFVTYEEIAKLLYRFPDALLIHPVRIEQKVGYLVKRGLTPKTINKAILRGPTILAHPISLMESNFQYLRSLGANDDRIKIGILRSPQIVLCSNYELLEPKFQWFYSKGFSEQQLVNMFLSFPTMFAQSIESLEAKLDYITNEMAFSLDKVTEFPPYFGFSLEKRIKPRFERASQIFFQSGKHPSLSSILVPAHDEFEYNLMRMQENMDEDY